MPLWHLHLWGCRWGWQKVSKICSGDVCSFSISHPGGPQTACTPQVEIVDWLRAWGMLLRSKPVKGLSPAQQPLLAQPVLPPLLIWLFPKKASGFLRAAPSDIKGENKTGMLLWNCLPQCQTFVPLHFAQIWWMKRELLLSWDINHEEHKAVLLSSVLYITACGTAFFGRLDTLWRSFLHICLLLEGELPSSRKNETTPSSWVEGLGGNLT